MSEQIVLILVIFGGLIGLGIVGLAFWMMRGDPTSAKPVSPSTEPAIPVVDPASQPDTISPVEAASPSIPEPETTPPVEPALEAPVPVSTPETPGSPSPEQTPGWVNVLASPAPGAADLPPAPNEELLRLWRTPGGDLMVEVNSHLYRSRQDITDYATGQQIANASSDLSSFLNSAASGPIKAAPPTALPPLRPPEPASTKPPSFFSRPQIERPVMKVSLEEAARMEVKPPSMDISRQFRYLRDQQKKPEIQIKSVAEEIDEIMQVMIIGTPLAKRGLKVSDSSHGAIFSIDGHNYQSVDEIPDAEAREAVRTAIQKWDQK